MSAIVLCGCARCRQARRTAYLKANGKDFEVRTRTTATFNDGCIYPGERKGK